MGTALRILKIVVQCVTIIIPLVKGFIRMLEQNNFKNKI
jgi:hypothetical protein